MIQSNPESGLWPNHALDWAIITCKIPATLADKRKQYVSEVPHKAEKPTAEPLHTLFAQLVHACLKAAFDRVPIAVVDRVITGCALFALVTPLLLWVSWSKSGFLIILATAAACVGIIWLLIWLYPEDDF